MTEIIRLEKITKEYDGLLALNSVSLTMHEKEIIGLVGDNGAGKSTLLNILVGLYPPSAGKIYLNGRETRFYSPADARRQGIEIVYQFENLIEGMTIYENFFLSREIIKKGILGREEMRKKSGKALDEIGISKSPDQLVEALSGGEKQAVTLSRAFYFGVKVLLLDEPTAGLSLKEADRTLKRIKSMCDNASLSIMFVTHNLQHVLPIADRVVVLHLGEKICDKKIEHTSIEEITKLITTGVKEEEPVSETELT